jgi:hypothetical protein
MSSSKIITPGKKNERNDWLQKLLRPDGRPEVYDLPPVEFPVGEGYECFVCESQGQGNKRYKALEAFATSPAHTPGNKMATVCMAHLPDNAVIYDPTADLCRDKTGQNTWREE